MTTKREKPVDFLFARQGEEFHGIGRSFIRTFHVLLKTARLHDRLNDALVKPLQDLQEVLGRLTRLDSSWELKVRNDYLHLCDVRLKIDLEIFSGYHVLLDEFKRRKIGTFGIRGNIRRDELLEFMLLFLAAGRLPDDADPCAFLRERLAAARIEGFLIEPLEQEEIVGDGRPDRNLHRRSLMTFIKSLYLTRDILTAVDTRRVVNIRRVKKLVSTLVDVMNIDDSVLLGLTNIKNFDEYTFNHSVNVCILSIATGRRLGLSRQQLGELGLSAIFHDLGKVSLPHTVIAKPGRLDDGEWVQIEKHPVEGVKKLVQIKGLNEVTNKLIVSVFRHHNNLDRSGYPPLDPAEEIPYFSRIIRIADSFDAMTSARAYRDRHLSTVEAVEELWSLAGRYFEPAILKVFIATVGIYPIGSVVQLSSGEIAIVVRNHPEPEEILRPVVRTAAAWDERPVEPREIDLREAHDVEIAGYFASGSAAAYALDLLL